jgi:hypothetical protein
MFRNGYHLGLLWPAARQNYPNPVFTKLSEDSLNIRSSGKTNLPDQIVKIDTIYKHVFF